MIYFDNAATTPLDEEVLREMTPYFSSCFGNAQSQHSAGRAAANALTSARDDLACLFGCEPRELYFVSGGTEGCNTALKGVCAARKKGHLVISAIEHPALFESAKDMQKHGFEVTFVNPDNSGVITPRSIESAIRQDTVFCAVMAANNETGVIQPVEEIGAICRKYGVFYFCDCVQSAAFLPLPVEHCDALTVSAHKFYGPKGVGALYLKNGSVAERLISGGMQERGFRGGTVNVAGVVGLVKAYGDIVQNRAKYCENTAFLRDSFIKMLLEKVKNACLNTDFKGILPGICNVFFENCEGENLLFMLDLKGICASTGSACSAGAVHTSRVLTSMGYSEERANGSLRFSFGKHNTLEEAQTAVGIIKECVKNVQKV